MEPYTFPSSPLPPEIRAPTITKRARNRAEFTWDALPGVADYNYGYEIYWIEPDRTEWVRAFTTGAIVHEDINLLTEGLYRAKIRGTNACGVGPFSAEMEVTVGNFYNWMKIFERLDEYAKRLLPAAAYNVLLRTELEFPEISPIAYPEYTPSALRYIVPWEERGQGWWYQGQRTSNGFREGSGVEINSNGEDFGFIAIGHYLDDEMIGKFLTIYWDGLIGRGRFRGRRQQGTWRYTMIDGTTYIRTFDDGVCIRNCT